MPRYEYICKSCSYNFEVQQSFSDDPLTICEKCGGELRKVFGNIGITFKGSGFYKTDSRSSSTSTVTPTSTTAESAPAAPSETAKPATEAPASTTPAATPTPAAG
ncbi:MAG: FmdB family transcriptional regulator [Actinomycetota bacterium]|jgi:putative FmdB family regulatory protein|nr:FmdB family transcriptional regulator [Actinomycetota bacterium]